VAWADAWIRGAQAVLADHDLIERAVAVPVVGRSVAHVGAKAIAVVSIAQERRLTQHRGAHCHFTRVARKVDRTQHNPVVRRVLLGAIQHKIKAA